MYIIHERLRRLKAVIYQPVRLHYYVKASTGKCLVIIFYIEFRITLTMDKDILFIQCSLGIDVIENFDYMNQVNKTN